MKITSPTGPRRVVTANDADGQSYFLHDGPAPVIVPQAGRGLTFFELWETDGPLASTEGTDDAGARPVAHHPPTGGTRFRIVELLPDTHRDADAVEADFAGLQAAGVQTGSTDPTMHRNETVDYNIVLSGQVVAVTDAGETLLSAGDVLIQRGTAHTWHNRGTEPCVFASVMVSATPNPLFTDTEEVIV